MIIFLKDKEKNPLVDIAVYVVDNPSDTSEGYVELHSSVMIDTYSKFLLENLSESDEIINVFQQLSEMRGWLWEVYFMGRQNDSKEYPQVLSAIRELIQGIAKQYNLYYVED